MTSEEANFTEKLLSPRTLPSVSSSSELVIADVSIKYMVDPFAEIILRKALELQGTFVDVLRSLDEDFFQPLISSQVGPLCGENEKESFKKVISFTPLAEEFAFYLQKKIDNKEFSVLATLLYEKRSYTMRLKEFCENLRLFVTAVRSLRKTQTQVDSFLGDVESKLNHNTFDDVISFVANYPIHLYELCKAQLDYRPAFQNLHASAIGVMKICKPFFPRVTDVQPFFKYDLPPNDFVDFLEEIMVVMKDILALNDSSASGQIAFPPNVTIPFNFHRKLIQIVPGRIQYDQLYGLAFTVSASLIIFNDSLILCQNAPSNSYRKYFYKQFYDLKDLWLSANKEQNSLLLATREPCPNESVLPPGWTSKVSFRKRKSSYIFADADIKQEKNPMSDGVLKCKQVFIVDASESATVVCQKIRDIFKKPELPECKPPVHVMVKEKMDLKQLIDFERVWDADLRVPQLLKILSPMFISEGLNQEGIFRVDEEKRLLEELTKLVNTHDLSEIEWHKYSIHIRAGLLKSFLRNLEKTIIPAETYPSFLALSRGMDVPPNVLVSSLVELIRHFPEYNLETLRMLLKMLYQVSCNSLVNKMSSHNLGAVFSPGIIRAESLKEAESYGEIISFMIMHYPEIFEESPLGDVVRERAVASKEWACLKRKTIGLGGSVNVSVVDPEHRTVLAIDSHNNCALYDSETYTLIKSVVIPKEAGIPSAAIFCKGRFFVACMNSTLVIHPETLEVVHTLAIPAQCILAVGDGEVWIGGERKITIVSATTFETVETLDVKERSVMAMVNVRGQVWCALKEFKDKSVQIHQWEIETRKHVTHFLTNVKQVYSMTVFGDKQVWAATDNPCVTVWDIETKVKIANIDNSEHQPAFCLCALTDQIWFGSRNDIYIVDPNTFTTVGRLRGYHTDSIFSFAPVISRARTEVWSGGKDRSLCVWSVSPLPLL